MAGWWCVNIFYRSFPTTSPAAVVAIYLQTKTLIIEECRYKGCYDKKLPVQLHEESQALKQKQKENRLFLSHLSVPFPPTSSAEEPSKKKEYSKEHRLRTKTSSYLRMCILGKGQVCILGLIPRVACAPRLTPLLNLVSWLLWTAMLAAVAAWCGRRWRGRERRRSRRVRSRVVLTTRWRTGTGVVEAGRRVGIRVARANGRGRAYSVVSGHALRGRR